MRRLVLLPALALALAGCGSDGDEDEAEVDDLAETTTESATAAPSAVETEATPPVGSDLQGAVQAYSDAFLTGDGDAAYALLSADCQQDFTSAQFATVVTQAGDLYGSALPLESYSESIEGDEAEVTYTYSIAGINQTDEDWVNEGGWKNDDC